MEQAKNIEICNQNKKTWQNLFQSEVFLRLEEKADKAQKNNGQADHSRFDLVLSKKGKFKNLQC
ncbi:hypothetical protein [Peribacillus glennii]|uniref:Uncharacterized protein n=1 Tax=Peribacillus glennii TaxID=2303991 RepID=A0A372LDX3_9BACI|nr:hypothetical protein [Peribacillus glennii]RFU63415.1 hypothetical protein D0466_11805 [Peribacillus glennii]